MRFMGLALMALNLSLAIGCAGGFGTQVHSAAGSTGDPPSSNVSVYVKPSALGEVWQGTRVQFSAVVSGQGNQGVTWSVLEGSLGGVIDNMGLYVAPTTSGTFHVVATSQIDPTAKGMASIEVIPISVLIFPAQETLRIGAQRKFNGFVLAADQNVTWSMQEGSSGGEINSEGLYTAPNTTGTFHVIATSVFSSDVSSAAPVKVVNVGFVPIGDMGAARSGHTATLLVDGRVLVVGGTQDSAQSAELFVPTSTSFVVPSGQMVHVRTGHCASLLQDGRVLITGGEDASGSLLPTAELFDPATQSFMATGDLNQPRMNATATPLPNGKVLIAGGEDSGGAELSSAELYDPASGTFSFTGSLHKARSQHTATLLTSGKVLFTGSSSGTNVVDLFDPVSGLFTLTGSLLEARGHHTATVLPNGKVLILGGTQIEPPGGGGAPAAPVSLDSAETYDPSTGVFQSAGKLLTARDSHSATLLANGTVLVAGGYTRSFDGDAEPEWDTMFSVEAFDPTSSTSTVAASLETARAGHMATMLNDGQILITGGFSANLCCGSPVPFIANLASAELYK